MAVYGMLLEEYNGGGVEYLGEKSVEDNAVSVKDINKWYSKLISACKSKAETKEEIKERIKVLEECVSAMKKEYDRDLNMLYGTPGMLKYMLKEFIPFNSVYRFIKRQDKYAMIGSLSNLLIPGISITVRGITYKNMLKDNIDKTEEAIKYLKEKLKEM